MSLVELHSARKALDPRLLELIILPTEQCNFRCTYCYENFAIGRMQRPIIDGLLRLIAKRASDLETLHISWFGGEPLLATDIIYEVSSFAQHSLFDRGRRFLGSITTNGYLLTPSITEKLLEVGIRSFQVTLDGPERTHDASRVLVNGRGTFARIWENLIALKDIGVRYTNVDVTLRIHYDAVTAYEVADLLSSIRDELLSVGFFRVHFHPIQPLGGVNDGEIRIPSLSEHAFIGAMVSAGTSLAGLPATSAAHNENYVCYAARANSFVVRADGRLSKCTVALSDPRNTIGRLTPGGSLEIERESLLPWLRRIFSGDVKAIACPRNGLPDRSCTGCRAL